MVGDHRAHRWDVDHLAADLAHNLGTCEVLATTAARYRGVLDDHVGLSRLEVRPRCPGLLALSPYRGACICTALGTRLARPDRVSGGGLRGVLRVAADLRFEPRNPVAQRLVLGAQLLVIRSQLVVEGQRLDKLLRERCTCHIDGLAKVAPRVVDLRALRAQVPERLRAP